MRRFGVIGEPLREMINIIERQDKNEIGNVFNMKGRRTLDPCKKL